ncbi:MAG: flagellar hook-associated protein FlgL, partial [Candidatus Eremiobacteraeota bacterium]|nr:flagellar hook-associated protein FlgL [Candidatus Eremiobacteraeota bacterium]
MRISTSNLFDQQITAIDNQLFNQAVLGNDLSTGKQLNQPSDDPTQVSQLLQLNTTIAATTTSAQNTQQAQDELTQVDSTLGELTSALQSARQLTIRAASDVMSPANKIGVANQVEQIINQLVGLANTQYAGKYLFGGTSISSPPPVQTTGQPITSVTFNGNNQQQGELYADGATVDLSTTLQQAFNFNASDGSLNVFQVLQNLRNTLNNTGPILINGSGASVLGNAIDQSANAINGAGQVIQGTGTLGAQAASFAQPLTFGAGPTMQFQIDAPGGSNLFTFNPATDSIDNPSA